MIPQPNQEDLWMYIGDDVTWNLVITDIKGNPVDITSWKFWLTVKALATDADPGILQVTQITHDSPTKGLTHLTVPHSSSSGVTAAVYYYDIQSKDANGLIYTHQFGNFTFYQDYTKSTT